MRSEKGCQFEIIIDLMKKGKIEEGKKILCELEYKFDSYVNIYGYERIELVEGGLFVEIEQVIDEEYISYMYFEK